MKRAKKPATRAYKTLRAKPEASPAPREEEPPKDALTYLVASVFKLNEGNPWLLAAAVDWIRTQWRGEAEVLARPLAMGEAAMWIKDRAEEMRTRAMGEAVKNAIRAAVTA